MPEHGKTINSTDLAPASIRTADSMRVTGKIIVKRDGVVGSTPTAVDMTANGIKGNGMGKEFLFMVPCPIALDPYPLT